MKFCEKDKIEKKLRKKEKVYPTRNKKGKGQKGDNRFHSNPYKH